MTKEHEIYDNIVTIYLQRERRKKKKEIIMTVVVVIKGIVFASAIMRSDVMQFSN